MKKRLHGFSIVELLIAMTLGLVLSAGIIQVFLANRQAQRIEQSVARVQENGRLALELITQDLRMAGFVGCGAFLKNTDRTFTNHVAALAGNNNTFDGVNGPLGFSSNSVRGFSFNNNVWTPALGQGVNAGAVAGARPGSDVLSIYFGEQVGAVVQGSVNGAGNISVDRLAMQNSCFTQNQIVMISDCKDADVIAVTNAPNCNNTNITLEHAVGLNSDNLLGTATENNSYSSAGIPAASAARPRILAFRSFAYFVRDSGRTNADGGPVMSLFRWNGTSATELVEGVEFLRIEFGQKITTGANLGNIRYVMPANVTNWGEVTSVRVGILAQGFDAVRDINDATNYLVAGQEIPAIAAAGVVAHSGGRTLRQAYTATIELRNRQ